MATLRSHLVMLALAVASSTYLGQTGAMYTGTAVNHTSLDGDRLSARGYYVIYGNNDPLIAERQLDAMASGNGTQADYQVMRRDVWNPKITSPRSGTVWVAGTTVRVTWDTSDPPQQITSTAGRVLLGHVDDGTDENLNVGHPLAEDFDLRQGSVEVKVPYVSPGNDYIVVVMGDSGNQSPTFTIN